jgi:hypothetical protein
MYPLKSAQACAPLGPEEKAETLNPKPLGLKQGAGAAVYVRAIEILLEYIGEMLALQGGSTKTVFETLKRDGGTPVAKHVRCLSGFGFRVSGFGFRVSGFGFRVSGFGFRV